MLCDLCGFLIIKSQIALHHAVRCIVTCGIVMLFYDQFWCSFYILCNLVNTPSPK